MAGQRQEQGLGPVEGLPHGGAAIGPRRAAFALHFLNNLTLLGLSFGCSVVLRWTQKGLRER